MCWDIHLLRCHFLTVKMFRIFSPTAALSITPSTVLKDARASLPLAATLYTLPQLYQQVPNIAPHIQYLINPVSLLAAVKRHVGSTCGWLYTRPRVPGSFLHSQHGFSLTLPNWRGLVVGQHGSYHRPVRTIQSRPDECFSHHLELRHKNLQPSGFFRKRETVFKPVITERCVLKTFCACALLLFH